MCFTLHSGKEPEDELFKPLHSQSITTSVEIPCTSTAATEEGEEEVERVEEAISENTDTGPESDDGRQHVQEAVKLITDTYNSISGEKRKHGVRFLERY